MLRLFLLASAIVCSPQFQALAEEPAAPVSVVAADPATVSLLPALPKGTRLSVLIRDESEPEEVVHARAFKLRIATYFVYCGECESLLSAMYRERLQNQGAIVIVLRASSQPKLTDPLKQRVPASPRNSGSLSLASLTSQQGR